MAFCVLADIENRLQWDITDNSDPRVLALIDSAQALIETYVGRPLESATHTEIFNGKPGALQLEHWPVTGITSVTEDGTVLAADQYVVDNEVWLRRVSGGHQIAWLTSKLQSITVIYTGGFLSPDHDLELANLKDVCTEIVARAFMRGAASAAAAEHAAFSLAGISSVKMDGSDAVTFSNPGGETIELGGGLSRFVMLLDAEKTRLNAYRTPLVA